MTTPETVLLTPAQPKLVAFRAGRFIAPSCPTPARAIPRSAGWIAELKFDGYRCQIHTGPHGARLYSRNGHDFGKRFKDLSDELSALKRDLILDGELIVADSQGRPDFQRLRRQLPATPTLWAFDLIACDGDDLRPLPLWQRRLKLEAVIRAARLSALQFSEEFDDPTALLAHCEHEALEGIVMKRRDAPYHSGPSRSWIKIKTDAWRAAHRHGRNQCARPAGGQAG